MSAAAEPTALEKRIRVRSLQMTPAQRKLSSYILTNTDRAVFSTASQLASSVGLSDATVTRYAYALGFDSFDHLRRALQDHYHAKMGLMTRLQDKLGGSRAGADFHSTVATEIEFLQRSLEDIRSADVERAGGAIAEARKVFIAAERPAWCLMDLLDFRLTRFGLDVVPSTPVGRYRFEKARFFTDRDVVILLAFQHFSNDLESLLLLAQARETQVVVITDLSLVPAMAGDEIVLSAKRGPIGVSNSLIVPMGIVHAIVLEVAASLGESGISALGEIDDLRSRYE